jgi:hypothetical protein
MEKLQLNMNSFGLESLFPQIEIIDEEVFFGQPDLSFVKSAIKTAYEQNSKSTGQITGINLIDIEVEGENDEYTTTITFETY